MVSLKQDWLTEGLIDFEYKKYLLLAYLQQVEHEFEEKKLYPTFAELIAHQKRLEVFQQQKQLLMNSFPKEISRIDFEQWQVQYKALHEDTEVLKELEEIAHFAHAAIREKMSIGKELYEEVEAKVAIYPVGILPLHIEEGYLLIADYIGKLVSVYAYQITLYEGAGERYRAIHTHLVHEYALSITHTYEQIKWELIKQQPALPAPATYVLEFKQSYPLDETMLPIAKRLLVRHVTMC